MVAVKQGGNNLIGRHVVSTQALGVGMNDDRALIAPKRRRRRDPRQTGEHRANMVERLVLDLANRLGLAAEDEVTDRHAAGIETHDKRRHGPRRHERARAVDVVHCLGHRLGHVGARVE